MLALLSRTARAVGPSDAPPPRPDPPRAGGPQMGRGRGRRRRPELKLPKVTVRREASQGRPQRSLSLRQRAKSSRTATGIELTRGAISAQEIREIFALGQEMLAHPVELLPGVAEIVPALARDYRLLLITKGDLHHQERKIAESGLTAHFFAIEILSEKDGATYECVLRRHGIAPDEFVMIGNSLKSDILPVLELGGAGVHVPYHITWQHEHVEAVPHDQPRFRRVERLSELLPLLPTL
jgi:putative hydrolase of the HAD superfamily